MENSNAIVWENHQVNEEKPPPRVCPRCYSDNTRFCYYNNHKVSQPRYNCKGCGRLWTHGGVLRGSKIKRTSIDQPYESQVVFDIEHVNNYQPFARAQENNSFPRTFGGSSAVVGNHLSSFPQTHGDMVPPIRHIPPMDRFGGSFNQGYNGPGFNDLVGNPLMNQSFGGRVYDHNSYLVNHEDLNNRNQSFNNSMNMNMNMNNSMNMNYNASTSGSRGYPSTNHWEKYGH